MDGPIVCDSCGQEIFRDTLIQARTAAMKDGWKFHPVAGRTHAFVVCEVCTGYYADRRRRAVSIAR